MKRLSTAWAWTWWFLGPSLARWLAGNRGLKKFTGKAYKAEFLYVSVHFSGQPEWLLQIQWILDSLVWSHCYICAGVSKSEAASVCS